MASIIRAQSSSNLPDPKQYYCGCQQTPQQHFLSHHRSLQHNFVFISSKQTANCKPRTLDRVVQKRSLKKITTAVISPRQADSGCFPPAHQQEPKSNVHNSNIKSEALIVYTKTGEYRRKGNQSKQSIDHNGINKSNRGGINRKRSPAGRRVFAFPPPIHHEPLPISPFKNMGAIKNTNNLLTTGRISSIDQLAESSESIQNYSPLALHSKEISCKQMPWGSVKQSIVLEDYRYSGIRPEDNWSPDLPQELPETSIFANFREEFVQSVPSKQIMQSIVQGNTLDSQVLSKNLSTREQLQSFHDLPKEKIEFCKRRLNYKTSIRQINTARKMASDRMKTDGDAAFGLLQKSKNSPKCKPRISRLIYDKPRETQTSFGSGLCVCSRQMMDILEEDRA